MSATASKLHMYLAVVVILSTHLQVQALPHNCETMKQSSKSHLLVVNLPATQQQLHAPSA